MMRRSLVGLLFVVAAVGVSAQDTQREPVEVRCPTVLGIGLSSDVPFCDIEVQRDPHLGILVVLPERRGEATLSFSLHNRHTYSEQEAEGGRGYAQYLASIAVATMEGAVLARGVVLSEFRAASDLIDRVSGGAGPEGVKAIAPTGTERLRVTVPDGIDMVSIVGQRLEVVRLHGRDTFAGVGRPIAVLSDAQVEYRPR
jgi:hypothetical protein